MLKRAISAIVVAAIVAGNVQAQKEPEFSIPQSRTTKHMNILASDELQGRNTGHQGNLVAARYIAEQYRSLGIQPVNNGSYFQKVALEYIAPPANASIVSTEGTAKIVDDFVLMSGGGLEGKEYPVVYLPYAWIDADYNDFKDVDVKGKVIITSVGKPNSTNRQDIFSAIGDKQKFAKERGAIAVVEVFNAPIPWTNLARAFGRKSLKLKAGGDGEELTHIWLNAAAAKMFTADKISKVTFNVPAKITEEVNSSNVVGVLEGSDPKLKNEYVVLSAHFDHVGFGKSAGVVTPEDSIFNGARDNAFGVVALLSAAESFSTLKPKRSVLFIAYTAEEVGLLGSKYYSENPLVPLDKCVFNMNCDGAGYNDISKFTVIGLGRTGAQAEFEKGAKAFGLKVEDDLAPEQNLFDRSDNVSLAAKGIPAPTFSPGFSAFDDAINKYYHKAGDNPDSVDHAYLLKYAQAYTYTARLIANRATAPKWSAGDKYEKAFNELYGK